MVAARKSKGKSVRDRSYVPEQIHEAEVDRPRCSPQPSENKSADHLGPNCCDPSRRLFAPESGMLGRRVTRKGQDHNGTYAFPPF